MYRSNNLNIIILCLVVENETDIQLIFTHVDMFSDCSFRSSFLSSDIFPWHRTGFGSLLVTPCRT